MSEKAKSLYWHGLDPVMRVEIKTPFPWDYYDYCPYCHSQSRKSRIEERVTVCIDCGYVEVLYV